MSRQKIINEQVITCAHVEQCLRCAVKQLFFTFQSVATVKQKIYKTTASTLQDRHRHCISQLGVQSAAFEGCSSDLRSSYYA